MDFQKVAEKIEASSQEIKDILFSEEIGNFLQEIAVKNNLDEETSLKLVDEIGYIILGLKEKSSLKTSLAGTGVPMPAILSITLEVEKKIFTELEKIESINTTESNDPVIITQETKDSALKELSSREEGMKNLIPQETKEEAMKRLMERRLTPRTEIADNIPTSEIEAPHENLPMVEPRETVHDVPHIEEPVTPPPPPPPTLPPVPETEPKLENSVKYPGGKDPYREQIG